MGEPQPTEEDQKLDGGITAAYRIWRENPDLSPDAAISVTLSFDGDLGSIAELGFEPHTVFGNQALGVVRFRDVETLVADSRILWLSAGEPPRPRLDTAARDIWARASQPIPSVIDDGLWHADVATGALTAFPNATGKGVIVAVIDSGIDYTHPMFIDRATKKTRILRIWDLGLTPRQSPTDHRCVC